MKSWAKIVSFRGRVKSEEKRDSESRIIPSFNSWVEKGEPAREIMEEQRNRKKIGKGCVAKPRLCTKCYREVK